MVVAGLLSWTQEDEKESGLRQNTGKETGMNDKDKKNFVTFMKFTQAPMFPLPIASDLKRRASCADSERQRDRETEPEQ